MQRASDTHFERASDWHIINTPLYILLTTCQIARLQRRPVEMGHAKRVSIYNQITYANRYTFQPLCSFIPNRDRCHLNTSDDALLPQASPSTCPRQKLCTLKLQLLALITPSANSFKQYLASGQVELLAGVSSCWRGFSLSIRGDVSYQ